MAEGRDVAARQRRNLEVQKIERKVDEREAIGRIL